MHFVQVVLTKKVLNNPQIQNFQTKYNDSYKLSILLDPKNPNDPFHTDHRCYNHEDQNSCEYDSSKLCSL